MNLAGLTDSELDDALWICDQARDATNPDDLALWSDELARLVGAAEMRCSGHVPTDTELDAEIAAAMERIENMRPPVPRRIDFRP